MGKEKTSAELGITVQGVLERGGIQIKAPENISKIYFDGKDLSPKNEISGEWKEVMANAVKEETVTTARAVLQQLREGESPSAGLVHFYRTLVELIEEKTAA